ncbi:MAG: hypothetical protein HYR63_10450 [Proteobacteria bacterium]|nr:hypothetical protein [Pseudomonadota bacterium]
MQTHNGRRPPVLAMSGEEAERRRVRRLARLWLGALVPAIVTLIWMVRHSG